MNKKSNKFPPEVRERAVRRLQEHRGVISQKSKVLQQFFSEF